MPLVSLNNKESVDKTIIPAIIAILIFLVLFFLATLSAILSAVISTGIFFLAFAILQKRENKNAIYTSPQKENLKYLLEPAAIQLELIANKIAEIENSTVRYQIKNIHSIGEKIVNEVTAKPELAISAKMFFNYYLDATNSIITKYIALQKNKDLVKTADITLKKTEDLISIIESSFSKQLEKLYDNDIRQLDIELKVLANTIKMEGL